MHCWSIHWIIGCIVVCVRERGRAGVKPYLAVGYNKYIFSAMLQRRRCIQEILKQEINMIAPVVTGTSELHDAWEFNQVERGVGNEKGLSEAVHSLDSAGVCC